MKRLPSVTPAPEGSFLDSSLYLSADLFEKEMSEVLPRSWVFVSDRSVLSATGDFVTEMIGNVPVVVVVDRDGQLRAHVNVCTHRASTLLDGIGNCERSITCPYHGWIFGLDGALLGVPSQADFSAPIDRSTLALKEVRVDCWEQFVFVNVSGDAPPLLDWLSPIPERMSGHQLGDLTRTHELDDMVDVNWKIMIDNAYCDYHLGVVHGLSIGAFVDQGSIREELGDTTGVVTTRWKPEQLASFVPPIALHGDAALGTVAASVYPNFFIAAFPSGGASVMWWTPTDQWHTRARVLNYARNPEGDPRAQLQQLRMVQDEDIEICRRVQSGIRSGHYRPGPSHRLETRIRGFQRWLVSMLNHDPTN